MAPGPSPIIVKKIKKGGHGHHGGAWKVAYADFVTAMMAFFLLLWLLNAVSQEQLEGISNYFAPIAVSESTSGAGSILEGSAITQTTRPSNAIPLPSPIVVDDAVEIDATADKVETVREDDAAKIAWELEERQFTEAREALNKAVAAVPALQDLADSLLVDNTVEGLRIQIVDQEGLAMFPRGGSAMYAHTRNLMGAIAEAIAKLPQKLSISGHTDATKFVNPSGYSNWELSSDRANASRRALVDLGVPEDRIARVVGQAETDPLFADDPTNPRNRRISVILLREVDLSTSGNN